MNKNSKNARKLLAKAKSTINCSRARTQPNSTALHLQNYTLNYGTQARLSKAPKVAADGCKNPNGPSIMEQSELYYGPWLAGK